MDQIIQIIIKLFFTLVAFFIVFQVWQTDIDVRKLFDPRRWLQGRMGEVTDFLPSREPNVLYQSGQSVARSILFTVDVKAKTIMFSEITDAESFDPAQEFEFRQWRLRCHSTESETFITAHRLQDGKILKNVSCSLLGTR